VILAPGARTEGVVRLAVLKLLPDNDDDAIETFAEPLLVRVRALVEEEPTATFPKARLAGAAARVPID